MKKIHTILTSLGSIASVISHIQHNGGRIYKATQLIANLISKRIDLFHVGDLQGIKVKWRKPNWNALINEFTPEGIDVRLVELKPDGQHTRKLCASKIPSPGDAATAPPPTTTTSTI